VAAVDAASPGVPILPFLLRLIQPSIFATILTLLFLAGTGVARSR